MALEVPVASIDQIPIAARCDPISARDRATCGTNGHAGTRSATGQRPSRPLATSPRAHRPALLATDRHTCAACQLPPSQWRMVHAACAATDGEHGERPTCSGGYWFGSEGERLPHARGSPRFKGSPLLLDSGSGMVMAPLAGQRRPRRCGHMRGHAGRLMRRGAGSSSMYTRICTSDPSSQPLREGAGGRQMVALGRREVREQRRRERLRRRGRGLLGAVLQGQLALLGKQRHGGVQRVLGALRRVCPTRACMKRSSPRTARNQRLLCQPSRTQHVRLGAPRGRRLTVRAAASLAPTTAR